MVMVNMSYGFLITITVLVAALLVFESEGLNDEGQYLLKFKSGLVDRFDHLGSWNSNDFTPCGWRGVNCSSGYNPVVLSLDLSSMNLSGYLSPSIGGLVHLNYLDLSFNELTRSIPEDVGNCSSLEVLYLNDNNFIGQIPKPIATLSSLRVLNLCNNRLSGPIHEEIGNLSSLSQLIAYSNNLSGILPRSLGNLKRLRTFRAGENLISGRLPTEIGECESLEFLGLAENQLSEEMPKELGMLENLEALFLWGNQLSGVIPKELGNCTNLEILALYENKLVGEIPRELGNIAYLKKLYLYRNMLNGTVPREIGNLSLVAQIDLSENLLSGEIPVELSRIAGLQLLYLFKNRFTGVIPDEFTSLTNLTKLDLSINFLTGSIPTRIQYLTELIMLQLFHNLLSGVIPQGLGVYSALWVVDLSENFLTGGVPHHLCRNSNMILLNLGSNRLTGNIPNGITSCKSLVQLRLVGNNLTGTFPSEMCKLVNLSTMELDQNKFRGAIPPEIGNCRTLQRLHLSGNYFTSELPREIGSLPQLVTFNVSSNSLSGRIPPEIFNCKTLQRLDLSNNNFSDALPSEIGTLSQLELLKLSENNLSGNIPVALGNLVRVFQNLLSLLVCNLSYNALAGPIPHLPFFQNMNVDSFVGNKGLCGGPLGDCATLPSSPSFTPDMAKKRPHLGKIIAIIAAAIGGVSLILIAILVYVMRRPMSVAAGFTFQDLVAATENIDESFAIGRGACGTVYKAVLRTDHTVAVKKVASSGEGNNVDNSFHAEILTLGKIRHRNIVKLYGLLLPGGSLGELLHGTSCSLDWTTRFMIALGAAQGLSYLHHDGKQIIFHRDIKSNDILLDDKFESRVGDFGLAKVMDMPQSTTLSVVAGSYGYITPEYVYTLKVTEKCDIYSFGVVLLELLTGRTPVQSIEEGGDLVTWVRNYFLLHLLSSGVLDARLDLQDEATVSHMITVLKIALMCTSMSPFDRRTMREVVSMLIGTNERERTHLESDSSNHDTKSIDILNLDSN
ncbi:leucine-rich repeat receptor-like protein kinase [Pyrus ussuriensis x Pyrus communis]|uniref:non-specific serine/threonine protein kinase n=1 Tax=Pyrus ussuriensis x Pyrus communis TaxID=2448454 RepID=A0A5N5HQQ0_9ROSA|nr:leucine-rich repeat receptor-like protein kinase [Pyrus ussuriensis x Pyrus communis]